MVWKEQQAKGLTAFSNAYETDITLTDIERAARALVVYRNGNDFLEALLLDKAQSEDARVEDLKFEAHLMEETFKRQAPGAQIMHLLASETIGNINFLKTSFTILLANGKPFYSHSYNGIVNGKELRVNIVFSDPQTGEQLLSAWRSSDFGITKQKI